MRITRIRPALIVLTILFAATTLWGYALLQPTVRWPDGNIVMHEQLGLP